MKGLSKAVDTEVVRNRIYDGPNGLLEVPAADLASPGTSNELGQRKQASFIALGVLAPSILK